MKKISELDQLSFQRSVIREEYKEQQSHNENSISRNQYRKFRYTRTIGLRLTKKK
jgi:hypothetical protein